MTKNIWLLNHYATNQFLNKSGRHFWFAKYLKKHQYNPTVFCANTIHNSNDVIHIPSHKHRIKNVDSLPFVFVKTNRYEGNDIHRVRNMINFYKNMRSVGKKHAKYYGKPDVIIASSVHPLTLVAGIQLAKTFNIPCICEVRDLWPESMVAYDIIPKDHLFTRMLYHGEKWIYQRADAIIMTWEGGKDYIVDRQWQHDISLDKIYHINNGVVMQSFDDDSKKYVPIDHDLQSTTYKNVIYTGSIRKVNDLGLLLDVAKIIKQQGYHDLRFLIYGTGNEKEMLKKRCKNENISNVIFKGEVERKFIPAILKQAHINLLHNQSTSLDKYGQSQNKLFEYLAAGRAIVQTYETGYSICKKYNCGLSAKKQTAEEIAKTIIKASQEPTNKRLGENARKAASQYDFNVLTKKLIQVIESVV